MKQRTIVCVKKIGQRRIGRSFDISLAKSEMQKSVTPVIKRHVTRAFDMGDFFLQALKKTHCFELRQKRRYGIFEKYNKQSHALLESIFQFFLQKSSRFMKTTFNRSQWDIK